MKKNLYTLFLACLTLLFFNNSEATIHTITVANFSFSSIGVVTYQLGDTVRWSWSNGTHTTTSGVIPAGANTWSNAISSTSTSFDYVPNVVGTYNYYCIPHSPNMTGSFRVSCSVPNSPTISASPTTGALCPGGTVNLTAPLASGVTYTWKLGTNTVSTAGSTYTATAIGSYTVTLSKACGTSTSPAFTVTQGASPTFSALHSNPNACAGRCDTITLSGTAGNTYTVNPTLNTTVAGNLVIYCPASPIAPGPVALSIKATNTAGCSTTRTETTNVSSGPTANFTNTNNGPAYIFNNTSTDTAANGTTYSWDFGDATALSTLKNPVHNYSATGTFVVKLTVTNPGGCQSIKTTSIMATVGIVNIAALGNIKIYPNPVNNTLSISGLADGNVVLTDLTGRVVLSKKNSQANLIIDCSGLVNGLYLLSITNDKGTALQKVQVLH